MRRDRRHALKVLSTAALGTAIAGCIGDDTTESTDDPDRPEEFAIEHLRLVTEQPAGYRDYKELEAGAYPPDAVVWLYLEPVGITTEPAGSGQERIELTASLEVTDPDGEELAPFEQEIHRDIPEGATDELYLYFHFTPPTTPPIPGEYTADLTVRDDFADEAVTETRTFRIERSEVELELENLAFVESQPEGYGRYTVVADPVYDRDEAIWLYGEPVGLTVQTIDGDLRVHFRATVTLTAPDGDDADRMDDEFVVSLEDEADAEEVFVYFDIDLRLPQLGEYTAEVTIRDLAHRGTVTETTSFTIEDLDLQILEIFEEVILEEYDIAVEELVLREDTVTLRYQSTKAYDDEAWGEFEEETAYIVGSYAGSIQSGLSADLLRGLVIDTEGTELSYRVETETVERYNDGDISEEELLEEVFRTLRPR